MIAVPEHIKTLRPYQPGMSSLEVQQRFGVTNAIKLASNENPLGPSPLALEGIRASLNDLYLYPDAGIQLRKQLADRFVIKPENVICGSGSESIIATALHTFLGADDEMISSAGTFIGFRVLAHVSGAPTHYVPMHKYRYDLSAIADNISERTKIIYVSNPNNPTGSACTVDELESFMERVPETVLVILDEAYFEYTEHRPEYPDSMKYRWDNVLTCRSFSKAYGLAGIRIGYGMAHSDIIAAMMKVKLPFEPSSAAAAAGLAALSDIDFLKRTVALNNESIAYYGREFDRLGLKHFPSYGNFVMIDFGELEHAVRVHEGLLQNGVITRPLGGFGLPHCLRISTGTMDQNATCVAALEAVLTAESTVRP